MLKQIMLSGAALCALTLFAPEADAAQGRPVGVGQSGSKGETNQGTQRGGVQGVDQDKQKKKSKK